VLHLSLLCVMRSAHSPRSSRAGPDTAHRDHPGPEDRAAPAHHHLGRMEDPVAEVVARLQHLGHVIRARRVVGVDDADDARLVAVEGRARLGPEGLDAMAAEHRAMSSATPVSALDVSGPRGRRAGREAAAPGWWCAPGPPTHRV
jgi:hypothetical protein